MVAECKTQSGGNGRAATEGRPYIYVRVSNTPSFVKAPRVSGDGPL